MSKLAINREAKYYKHLTRLSGLILFIFAYAVVITGSTYAFKIISATSNVATGEGGCFQVNYSGQNLNAGDLLTTTNYLDGAHTTVTLSKDSTCKIYNEANIYLHTNDTTTAPIDSKPALRYKLLSGENEISEGIISSKGDYILATVPITDTATTYTVYLWIDSDLSEGAYHGTSFSGYIYAESAQTSTIENQYLVSFNANGGEKIAPKTVTYGSTYGTLPTPTRNGYTFAGWSLVPSEYQQVEYIEASGTQYILTDVIPSSNFKLIADVYQSSSYTGESAFAGVRDTTDNKGLEYYFVEGKPKFWLYNGSNAIAIGGNTETSFYNQMIHYEASRTASEIKMETSVTETYQSTYSSSSSTVTPLTLFAYNFKGTPNYLFRGRIHNLQIYSNNSLVASFIPCYKKTDATHPGMCDTVTGKFYENAGTGSFTAGTAQYITSSSTVTQEHNHTLYAVWTPKTYTVTFNANGGTVSTTTKQVTMGQPYGTLPTPTRSGYTFKGWNGKNKFDKTKYLNMNNYSNYNSGYQWANIILKPNTTYKISVRRYNLFDGKNNSVLLISPLKSPNGDGMWSSIAHETNPNNSTCNYINNIDSLGLTYIGYHKNTMTQEYLNNIWNNTDVQIEEGTEATEYEPYYVATSTTVTQAKNHTLTAIWEQN